MKLIELDDVSLHFRVRLQKRASFKDLMLHELAGRRKDTMHVKALDRIDLAAEEGDRLGIVGHNGAGKSTLLKLLAGIYPPTAGTRRVSGRVSSLFDMSLGFEPEANGWDNIRFRSYLQGETPRSVAARMQAVAEFSELGKFLDMPVRHYSSGMLVRLAFSVATAIEPDILIVDEVLGAGDGAFQVKARQRMRTLISNARAVVVVSHDLDTLTDLCNKVVWLDHGQVRKVGPAQDVLEAYRWYMVDMIKQKAAQDDIMDGDFNDSRLRIIAAQLASAQAYVPRRSLFRRIASRIKRELLRKGSLRERVQIAKCGLKRMVLKLPSGMRLRRDETRVNLPADRPLVLARCNGGLGDLIIYSAFLDQFYRENGRPVIHVLLHPLRLQEAAYVFRNSPAVAKIIDFADTRAASTPYDVVMTIGDFVAYNFVRHERLGRIAPAMLEKLTAAQEIQKPYRTFIDAQPLFDGLFAASAVQSGMRRLDLLGWLGNVRFGQDHQLFACPDPAGYRRWEELGLARQPYITIHNGWDNVAHRHTQNATKGWPPGHYERFVAAFKQRYPELLVVQLGAKTSRPIAGADIGLLDGTTLDEAAWILKHALIHVDGDSGLVHFARALHTKSVVLFGPTNHEFFRYEQNETCFSTVCGNCWFAKPNWMQECPRGMAEPVCMPSIGPAEVFSKVERHLRSLPAVELEVEAAWDWEPRAATAETDGHSQTATFEEWQGHFILAALKSVEPTEAGLSVANVENDRLPLSSLTGCQTHTFSFHDSAAGDGRTPADYGSIYNIPEENEAFDIVITPTFSDDVEQPYAAAKDALRILKPGGLLIATWRFDANNRPHSVFSAALEALGVNAALVASAAGGIALRKTINGLLFPERTSHANQAVGV